MAEQTALANARQTGIVPVYLVWVRARDLATGAGDPIGFWEWPEDITATVIDGETGAQVARTFVGGAGLSVGDITYVSDLTIQSVDVSMSQIADATQELVRGRNIRMAPIEIYDGLIDPATMAFVAPPRPAFVGTIDGAPITTPAAGGEGNITLTARSELMTMLTMVNPAKSSHAAQLRRGGDQFGAYASTVATWNLTLGKK
ncbi:MAG: hypothetical protein IE922_01490 [Sphingomonadales bacterium]|nr:hypothetical protein [Sphingomonadales bacterium]